MDPFAVVLGLLTGLIAAVLVMVATVVFFDPRPVVAVALGAVYALVCCGIGVYLGVMA